MKYLTKEWYMAVQNSIRYRHLISSERASVFSEEYFQELYHISEKDHLDFYRGVSTHIFDAEREKLVHREVFHKSLEQLKYIYPSDILKKIADLRVLALNYAAPEIIDEIRTRCLKDEVFYKSELVAKENEDTRNWKKRPPAFFRNFDFHDRRILSIQNDGNDMILAFHTNTVCRFKDAIILKNDGDLENATWLYNEFYPSKNGYEIHALLLTTRSLHLCIDSYSDLIIQCSDVEIQEVIP